MTDYDVLTQRYVHSGGTKEYQITSIRDEKSKIAYTIRRWGKIGVLRGDKIDRDDTRSGFHGEHSTRLKRGYEPDGKSSRLTSSASRWSTGNWTMSEREVQAAVPEDWRLMLAKIGRGPSPEELDVNELDSFLESPDDRAQRLAKPAKPAPPAETTTEDNPMFGAF